MKHVLLGLLEHGPAYGLELKQHYDSLVGIAAGAVNVGQIYTTLGRLEQQQLVCHRVEPSEVGPDRKVYRLSETGHKELQRWFEAPPSAIEFKSEALSRIVVALRLRRPELSALVRGHRGQCLEALRALDLALETTAGSTDSASADSASPESASPDSATLALVQAASLHIQADLRWLDYVESLMKATTFPGSDPGREAKQ